MFGCKGCGSNGVWVVSIYKAVFLEINIITFTFPSQILLIIKYHVFLIKIKINTILK